MLLFLFAMWLLENLKLQRWFACFYWRAPSGLLLSLPQLLTQRWTVGTHACTLNVTHQGLNQNHLISFPTVVYVPARTAKPFHVWCLDSFLLYGYLEMLLSFKVPLGHPHIMSSLPPCLHCTTSVHLHCDVFAYRSVDWKLLEMRGHILFYCISLHNGTWLALNW